MIRTGAGFRIGEPIVLHKLSSAPYPFLWTVAAWRRDRGLWRVQDTRHGTYVDAVDVEMIRPGRPDALEHAAMVAPLHEWARDDLRIFLELPSGYPCDDCGRPRMS